MQVCRVPKLTALSCRLRDEGLFKRLGLNCCIWGVDFGTLLCPCDLDDFETQVWSSARGFGPKDFGVYVVYKVGGISWKYTCLNFLGIRDASSPTKCRATKPKCLTAMWLLLVELTGHGNLGNPRLTR